MSDDLLLERRANGVAWVTFDRPRARNAITFAMYEALEAACAELDADAAVRALVVRGAGEAFVAGTQISEFDAVQTAADGVAYEAKVERVLTRFEALRVPTVALVTGPAAGAGLVLAAACDLRVATPAAKFAMPIARTLGNALTVANLARLREMLGPARVRELILTARLLAAEEALAAGAVTEVVPDGEDAEARAQALAEQVASYAPITVRTTREGLRRLRGTDVPFGDDLIRAAYASRDFREGVAAFTSRREPSWSGE